MMPDECAGAVACGVEAIMVSNHGGRQLDTAATPIDYLPAIRDRIQNDAQLIADGGICRGTAVLKAIALGADGCSIGRPYLSGLAAHGEAGVSPVPSTFRAACEPPTSLMARIRLAATPA